MSRSIMFLDLATKTGWAEGIPGERAVSGVVDFAEPGKNAKTTTGGVIWRMQVWLASRVSAFRPQLIVYESSFSRGIATTRRLYGLCTSTEAICHRYGIPVMEANLNEIRKQMLGYNPRGDGVKEAIISHVESLGYTPTDDNEADALIGWMFACAVKQPRTALKTTPLFQDE